jgi:hypothetical protein
MQPKGSSGEHPQLLCRDQVIEMGMRRNDLDHPELVRRQKRRELGRIPTWIDNYRVAGLRIADNVAIAGKRTDLTMEEHLEGHPSILEGAF